MTIRSLRRTYAMHGLRVIGTPALLDAGVPLWMASQTKAGHQTFEVTLRYDKPGQSAASPQPKGPALPGDVE